MTELERDREVIARMPVGEFHPEPDTRTTVEGMNRAEDMIEFINRARKRWRVALDENDRLRKALAQVRDADHSRDMRAIAINALAPPAGDLPPVEGVLPAGKRRPKAPAFSPGLE